MSGALRENNGVGAILYFRALMLLILDKKSNLNESRESFKHALNLLMDPDFGVVREARGFDALLASEMLRTLYTEFMHLEAKGKDEASLSSVTDKQNLNRVNPYEEALIVISKCTLLLRLLLTELPPSPASITSSQALSQRSDLGASQHESRCLLMKYAMLESCGNSLKEVIGQCVSLVEKNLTPWKRHPWNENHVGVTSSILCTLEYELERLNSLFLRLLL